VTYSELCWSSRCVCFCNRRLCFSERDTLIETIMPSPQTIEPMVAADPLANAEHLTHPRYRSDIDGLRAIAVLSVVAFHALPGSNLGGYIGVDIFFVISGFLISTIIFENLEKNRFSFVEFYSRRIRRIFPALLTVMFACLAIGWFALLSDEYAQLGRHISGGAGFVSNFLLWSENGYFDSASGTKPLLHLWSLGVEEQFYIVWPLLMWVAWKRRFNFLFTTLGIALASFAVNVGTIGNDAVAAFYSPLSRFWELLIGATLAYITLHRPDVGLRYGRPWANWWSILGFALIGVNLLILSPQDAFPGWWALLPTLGAAAVIFASPRAWLNQKLLAHPLLVWFGLISYPLYLWHWPLLSLARVIHGPLSRKLALAVVLVAIALAWLTVKLIEKPLRFGRFARPKTIGLTILMGSIGVAGYYIHGYDGMDGHGIRGQDKGEFYRYFADIPANRWQLSFERYFRHECNFYPEIRDLYHFGTEIDKTCYTPDQTHKNILFIWGDSHAQMLNYGLTHNLPKDWQILQIASSGCPASIFPGHDSEYCQQSNEFALEAIRDAKPNVVVIAQRGDHRIARMQAIAAELSDLGVGKVIFLGPVPQWNEDLPKKIVRRLWEDTPERTYSGIDSATMAVNSELKKNLVQTDGMVFVDPIDLYCDQDGCLTRIGPDRKLDITSWDHGHLTPLASDFLAKNLLVGAILGNNRTQ